MKNGINFETSIEDEIDRLLGELNDNDKLKPEYCEKKEYISYFEEHKKELGDNIFCLFVKHMNCETDNKFRYIIGVYMYIKHNYPKLSFEDVINKMFDKTNTKAKMIRFTGKKIS